MQTRRYISALAALAIGSAAVVGLAGPASAQQYPPSPPATAPGAGAGASDSTPAPGQTVTISSGAGTFTPGSTVTVTLGGVVVGTVTANSVGAAVIDITAPSTPGVFQVVFAGALAGVATTESVTITVVAPAAVANPRPGVLGALPRTGSAEAVPLAASGVALVVAGGVVVVAARRRRTELDAAI